MELLNVRNARHSSYHQDRLLSENKFYLTTQKKELQQLHLEITTCTEHQAASVQHLHFTNNAVGIGMLGSVKNRCK